MAEIEPIATATQSRLGRSSRITDLELVGDILYATTLYDGGLYSWRLDEDEMVRRGARSHAGELIPGGTGSISVLEVGGRDTILTGGDAGGGLALYGLSVHGGLPRPTPVANGTGIWSSLQHTSTLALSNGDTVVLGGLAGRSGVAQATFDDAGRLTGKRVAADTGSIYAADVSATELVRIGGRTYLYSASGIENGVTAWEVSATGTLSARHAVGNPESLWISAPTALETVTAGGRTWLVVAAAGTDSLSTLEVRANGDLVPTDHLLDSLQTRFGGVQAMAGVTHHGQTYIVAGGADDGISLLQMLPTGQLIHRATLADATDTTLANVSALAARSAGGVIEIYATSGAEDGVTRLAFDTGSQGVTRSAPGTGGTVTGGAGGDLLLGRDGPDRLEGRSGDDILRDGAGSDRLTGGSGADIFFMTADDRVDTITDFQPGTDRIDLSDWTYLRSRDQLHLAITDTGFRITYGDEVLHVHGAGRSPIDHRALPWQDLIGGTRIPIVIQPGLPGPGDLDPADLPTYGDYGSGLYGGTSGSVDSPSRWDAATGAGGTGDGTGYDGQLGKISSPKRTSTSGGRTITGTKQDDRLTGGRGSEKLKGLGGDDTLYGREGNDRLFGGSGNDRLIGGSGRDLLYGGEGRDRLEGQKGNDWIKGHGGNDKLKGEAGSDRLFGGSGDDLLRGGRDSDRLKGDKGKDVLYGDKGNDALSGGSRNDALFGGSGADRLYGGTGHDRLSGGSRTDLLRGDRGDDVLHGGAGDDDLAGNSGNDLIYGGSSHDLLDGGSGSDRLYGNAGNDRLYGGTGYDRLYGGTGNDRLDGGTGNDRLYGGTGHDTLSGHSGSNKLYGEDGRDILRGGTGNDLIYGGNDNDTLIGSPGTNGLYGHGGNDRLTGGSGTDRLYGGSGQDDLWAGGGTDTLWGGSGDDRLRGASGRETMFGGAGDDTMKGGTGASRLYGGSQDDLMTAGVGAVTLYGDAGDDRLVAGPGDDRLYGGTGDDDLKAAGGDDTLRGGYGSDRLEAGTTAATLYGDAGNDRLYGGIGADRLMGGLGDDILTGGDGHDALFGEAGNDTLDGGAGRDILTGGAGADTFVFTQGEVTITDIEAQDLLKLETDLWGGGLSAGDLLFLHGQRDGDDFVLTFGDDSLRFEDLAETEALIAAISFV